MKKHIKLTFSKPELVDLLKQIGVYLPDNANFWMDNNQMEIAWDEGHTPFALQATLSSSPQIRNFVDRNERIAAIKQIRTETGWGLRDAKNWLDHNFPVIRTF